MDTRQRRFVYGAGLGAVAFLVGWAITIVVVPLEFAWPRASPLKTGAWVWLAAHSMKITGGSLARFQQENLAITVANLPILAALRALPPLLISFASVLAIDAISDTRRPLSVLLNGSSVLLGYLGLGVAVYLLFDARPAISIYMAAAFVVSSGFLGLWAVIRYLRLDTEVSAVAAAGWVLLMGLIVFAGGDSVLDAVLSLVLVSLGGVLVGSMLILSIRRYT